jgi:ATP-dependent exoDNAse (exonuclease V) beta subunit
MKQSLNNLKIYKSSAGSGKTFTLSKSYLAIALASPFAPFRYREILAITFTNKAAAEMKSRVLQYLNELSSSKDRKYSTDILEKLLLEELKISPDELCQRASYTLEDILHNYSDFNITTIDKFIVRIVRAFNVEMRLSFNFEILLNDEELLSEAYDRLTTEIGLEKGLTAYFLNYQKDQIDSDEKWNIEKELLGTYKAAKYGKGEAHISAMEKYSYDDFQNIHNKIREKIKAHENTLENLSKKVESQKHLLDIPSTEIHQGNKFLSQLDKVCLNQVPMNKPLGKMIQSFAFDRTKWFNKDIPEETKIEPLKGAFREYAEYFNKNYAYYQLLKAIGKNFFPYTLIHYLHQKLQEVKKDNNVVLLSEFNEKINEIVLQEPVPFIYERIGERYKNYLIDEFQDTSIDQWQNLLPLLENALSYGETSLIVGDAKQAIYRFRGGEVEQFAKLPAPPSALNNPIVLERYQALERHFDDTTTPLTTNYRSKPEIIEFNNHFFKFYLEHKNLTSRFEKYYDTLEQKVGTKEKGGLIQIKTLPNQDRLELFIEELRSIVNKSKALGHKPSSICVICRERKEITEITEALYENPENDITVSSKEGLFIGNDEPTKFLFNAFLFLYGIQERSARLFCINHVLKTNSVSISANHQSEAIEKINSFEDFILYFYEQEITSKFLKSLSHFEVFEELISILQLDKNTPYIQTLLENILFQSKQSASEIYEWWEEQKNRISISAPEDENAIQMMTLHQSKGLEFGTVIVPNLEKIAKIELNKNQVWLSGNAIDLEYDHLLINLKKDFGVLDFGENKVPEIEAEVEALELDTINNLYVTFTRAENHLFIFDEEKKLGQTYIEQHTEDEVFIKGSWVLAKEEKKDSDWQVFELIANKPDNWRNKIKVSYSSPTIWNIPKDSESSIDAEDPRKFGNLIHLIFSEVNQSFEYNSAIDRIAAKGLIEDSVRNEIELIFKQASENQKLNSIWASGKQIKERELVDSKGQIIRPDLIIEQKDACIILDFKTGEPLEEDKKQIRYYCLQIEKALSKKTTAFLYYTQSDQLMEV